MLLVAMAHDLSVIEIPIRLRRRVGRSKGASQSLWKGTAVGLSMIWHIMSFRLQPSGPSVAIPADQNGNASNPSSPSVLAGISGSRDK
jgi:hypothetical protein